MYKLFSERIKDRNGEPEIYVYNEFIEPFRNQVFFIMEDVLEVEWGNYYWNDLYNDFCREKGMRFHDDDSYKAARHNCELYIAKCKNDELMDFIDFAFYMFNTEVRNTHNLPHMRRGIAKEINEVIDNAIKELNFRFKQHNLGYEFVNGEIIRIDNGVIHQEIVKPSLKLLYEEGFDGAEEEYRKAFEYRRKGDNKNAILEAGKSFESVMKTICDKKGYTYDKAKDSAAKLINILESNNFFPSYMSSHLANLRMTLETGLPVVRNKNAGHGQGSTVMPVSDEFTEYALNLAATNIVLLVGIYKKEKTGN